MDSEHFDFKTFWNDCDYSLNHYVMNQPSDVEIMVIEQELGYKLPQSYIGLMKKHNGGLVKKNCYVLKNSMTWAPDHIIITGMLGIGREKTYSLCGTLGTCYMKEQCGYPDIGVYICDTPAGDDEAIMLDYRQCGKEGEPRVVFIDKLFDYKITDIAKDFQTFINGLASEISFDMDDDEDEIDEEGWIEEEFNDEEEFRCLEKENY